MAGGAANLAGTVPFHCMAGSSDGTNHSSNPHGNDALTDGGKTSSPVRPALRFMLAHPSRWRAPIAGTTGIFSCCPCGGSFFPSSLSLPVPTFFDKPRCWGGL